MKEGTDMLGFVLQGIRTEQFAIFEENYNPKKETGLETKLRFKLNQKNQQIGVFIDFDFFQTKKVFLKIQVSCHFKVEEKSWNGFLHVDGSHLRITKEFLAHIAMITMGTARGVLFAKTESTPFSKFVVPLLDVAEIITEDTSFDVAGEQ